MTPEAPSERAVPLRAGALTVTAEKVERPPVRTRMGHGLPLVTCISVPVLEPKVGKRKRATLHADASARPRIVRKTVANASLRMMSPPSPSDLHQPDYTTAGAALTT